MPNDLDLFLELFKDSKLYDDDKTKEEIEDENNYKNLSNSVFKEVLGAFKTEDQFISTWRVKFSNFVYLSAIFQLIFIVILIIASIVLNITCDYEINITLISVVAVGVLVEIIGLLHILFKYIFNRKDNKILEIINSILNERSIHERNIKDE